MLPTAGNAPHEVLAVLRAHAAGAAGADQLHAIGAQPLSGGRNNVVYQWESPDGPACIKIYRVDDRHRAEREWPSCPDIRPRVHPCRCGPIRTPGSPLSA
jgi:hypothetical protein